MFFGIGWYYMKIKVDNIITIHIDLPEEMDVLEFHGFMEKMKNTIKMSTATDLLKEKSFSLPEKDISTEPKPKIGRPKKTTKKIRRPKKSDKYLLSSKNSGYHNGFDLPKPKNKYDIEKLKFPKEVYIDFARMLFDDKGNQKILKTQENVRNIHRIMMEKYPDIITPKTDIHSFFKMMLDNGRFWDFKDYIVGDKHE